MVDQPRDRLGRFLTPDKDKSHLGFNSRFGGRLGDFLEAAEQAGHKISIYSGKRSYARQKALFDAAVAKYGSVKAARQHVAPPGKSRHNLGLAADLKYASPEALAWAHAHAKEFGLNFRMSHENWHIEPAGPISQFGLGIGALLGPTPNPALPDVMQAPQMLADVQMREEAQRAIAATYRDPMRALDVVPSKAPPSSFPSRMEVPGRLPAAPSTFRPENIDRGLLGANPTVRSLAHPVSVPSARPLGTPSASRFSYGSLNAVRPSAPTVGSMPAASTFRPEAIDRALTGAVPSVDRSVSPATPGQLGGINMSNPKGDFSVGPSVAELAEQYGQYRTPTNYTNVRNLMNPPPAQPLQHPISVPAPPPDFVPPKPNILAPLMPQVPTQVKDYNVAGVPAAPPAAPAPTAYDVYSGLATQAKDNTGQNTVGMLPDGTTTVTNKYGVTTGMTPYGKQTAVGNIPGVPASFGRQLGKMAMPAVGSMALGPIGGLLGALAAYGLSRDGGLLSNVRNIDTSMIAGLNPTTQFAKPDHSLRSFPDAPSGGYRGSASFSNRSAEGMRGISPAAADAIGRGLGGLY